MLYLASVRAARASEREVWRLQKKQKMTSFLGNREDNGLKSVLTWNQLCGLRDNVNGSRLVSAGKGRMTRHNSLPLPPPKEVILQLCHALPQFR